MEWILTILTFKVPVFVIILIIIGLWVVKKIYNSFSSEKVDNSPQWLNYKKSKYKKWIFAWDYNLNSYLRQYEIIHLRPVCQCGCELSKNANGSTVHYSYGTLICPKCGKTYPEIYEEDILDFKKVLLYDINNDLYPKENIK
ncbi:hypothetical protein CS063_16795 [Sporanaerobium hydrogeniformans]|uniref:Uncharacterized protein n=1 Tax=Sporanaerobium hydrogeniformans TaxID=3072179 RepID=A0AC61D8S6_9FIRM|nr:hypothetical protein [Sporanaerobium hydrogeniformans]PHV69245.1 hypothetical protein CS063_16795 [Sporanaerobium hydrogeniformans]